MKRNRLLLFGLSGLIALFLWLSARSNIKVDCDSLISTQEALLYRSFSTKEQAVSWIALKYELAESEVDFFVSSGYQIHWSYQGIEHAAKYDGSKISSFTLRWENNSPRIGEMLECLGRPDYYNSFIVAWADANQLKLNLWYLHEGILVASDNFGGWLLPVVDENLQVTSITYVKPDDPADITELIGQLYGSAGSPISSNDAVNSTLRPWPGSIRNVITIDLRPK